MSLATRLVQSVLMLNQDGTGYGEGARIQGYTDDPWVVTKGTHKQIDRCFAIVLFGFHVQRYKFYFVNVHAYTSNTTYYLQHII